MTDPVKASNSADKMDYRLTAAATTCSAHGTIHATAHSLYVNDDGIEDADE